MDGLLIGIGVVLLLAALASRPARPDPVVIYVATPDDVAGGGGCLGPLVLALVVGLLLAAVR